MEMYLPCPGFKGMKGKRQMKREEKIPFVNTTKMKNFERTLWAPVHNERGAGGVNR